MQPKARLKITLACDRNCPYCINKCKEYRQRWQEITGLDQVKWNRYRSVIISGGEPTTDMRLRDITRCLRLTSPGTMIYLQTNGWNLTKALVKELDDSIDGIGLSIHDKDEFRHMAPRWIDISTVKPVKLYIGKKFYDDNLFDIAKLTCGGNFTVRVWKEGESDPAEEIFLLKGWQTNPRLNE